MRPAMRIRHLTNALAACVLALGLAGCTRCSCNESGTGQAAQSQRSKGNRDRTKKPRRPKTDRPETRKVKVGEETRRYVFARSRVTSPRKPAPVLLMLYDNGGNTKELTRRRDLMGGASKLGYLVAIPTAAKEGWGPGLCVDAAEAPKEPSAPAATKAKPPAAKSAAASKDARTSKEADAKADAAPDQSAPAPGSDVDFVKAILADLGGLGADLKRIYLVAVGGSAAFAERLVSELPGQFAGVTLFAPEDCKQKGLATPSSPIPILVVTGEEAPADGGTAPAAPQASADVRALDYWLKADTCDAKPQPGGSDGGVDEQRYTCKAGALVRAHLTTSAKPIPRKMGNKYTIRFMHEFFKANTH
jgi:poly(3-hydroxybutyrate) depolymerase